MWIPPNMVHSLRSCGKISGWMMRLDTRETGGPKQNAEVGQTSLPNALLCAILATHIYCFAALSFCNPERALHKFVALHVLNGATSL